MPDIGVMTLAIGAGVLYMAGFIFYFKAMYAHQEAVIITIMWSLGIALVPILSYFTLGEKFSLIQYVGIAVLFIGTAVAAWARTKARATVVGLMTVAVVLVSVSVVCMREAFVLLESSGHEVFWSGFICSTVGEGLVGLIVLVVMTKDKKRRLAKISRSYWPVFVLMEGSQISANALSSKALSIGTASLVSAIDGMSGAFAIVFSILAVEVFRGTSQKDVAKQLEEDQLGNIVRKLIGIAIVVLGAYLIG